METVAQILQRKGHQVWSVNVGATVLDAVRLMAEKNIGAVLVMDGDRVVGIFSERDFVRRVGAEGRDPATTPIEEVMTSKVLSIAPNATVEECLAVMTEKRLRHLPVVEAGRLVGVISIGDAVKAALEHRDFTIQQLVNYITGERS